MNGFGLKKKKRRLATAAQIHDSKMRKDTCTPQRMDRFVYKWQYLTLTNIYVSIRMPNQIKLFPPLPYPLPFLALNLLLYLYLSSTPFTGSRFFSHTLPPPLFTPLPLFLSLSLSPSISLSLFIVGVHVRPSSSPFLFLSPVSLCKREALHFAFELSHSHIQSANCSLRITDNRKTLTKVVVVANK